MLFGEPVELLGEEGEWAYVRTVLGSYEGFVRTNELGAHVPHSHRVTERMGVLYDEPQFKDPAPDEPLYYNSLITIEDSRETPEGILYKVRGSKWIFDTHIREKEYRAPDFLQECLKFLGTAYGYEKRGALIDCSTLVQAGCIAAGIECPFDVKSGEMEQLGEAVDFKSDFSNLRRGDLVFWKGHMGVMLDETRLLHANAFHMAVVIEPLADAIARIEKVAGPVTSVKRL